MKGHELRTAFLEFFRSKGHEIVASSALVPENDPTLLFSNAGMNQFKDLFLGAEKRSYTRATTSQKCLRISGKHNDFENVGMTARHHTFFEMLGNFSFGDYFKKEVIPYAWEFITEVLKLDKRRLWVTIFEDDDEAFELWTSLTDISKDRVLRLGEEENFWAMGDTGPCGPCSEIHYYMGNDIDNQSEAHFRQDDGSYLEFWNLVFMQFNRSADGKLTPLPKPSVDTGMGFERIASILQGKPSNYDTDLVRPIITRCEELTGFKYDGSSYEVRDLGTDKAYARDVAMRVVADHSRASAFMIADGVMPGSDGRGYVLRRIIRRAVRHGRVLAFSEPFLAKTCATVIETLGGHYKELVEQKDKILKVVAAEESKFYETLDSGLAVLQKAVEGLPKGQLFPGETAFLLHDTFGFPLDLTADALKPYNIQVDIASFDKAMAEQRERSREDRKGRDITFVSLNIDAPATKFSGYTEDALDSKLAQIFFASEESKSAGPGESVSLIFEETPFYAESGGQVGDTGTIKFKDVNLKVLDTQKVRNTHFVHECLVESGTLTPALLGQIARLSIDVERRSKIRVNHSATHLVHAALRKVLGDHVKQAGSRVDHNSSRFDYSHFEAVTDAQLAEIQQIVNTEIRRNHAINTRVLPIEEARKTGAVALFGEKYGDSVRVIDIGPDSIEFCGGTHANRSGDLGIVLVASEGGISSGVRRIECVCGAGAFETILAEREQRAAIADILKSDRTNLPEKVERLNQRVKSLEHELSDLQGRLAQAQSGELADNIRTSPGGIKVIAERVDGLDTQTLRGMVDTLRVKIGSGVVALGSNQGDVAIIVAGVTSDLTASIDAGALIKEIAVFCGGKGGGRKDFAQAGGVRPEMLGEALNRLFTLVN